MAKITGFIEKIKFRNEENGYTVLTATDQHDGNEVVMVGNFAYVGEGDKMCIRDRSYGDYDIDEASDVLIEGINKVLQK